MTIFNPLEGIEHSCTYSKTVQSQVVWKLSLNLSTGIYILLLSQQQIVGIVSDFYLNWQSFGQALRTLFNERKTFPNFSRYRQKIEKSHIFQHPFGNLAHNRVKTEFMI